MYYYVFSWQIVFWLAYLMLISLVFDLRLFSCDISDFSSLRHSNTFLKR